MCLQDAACLASRACFSTTCHKFVVELSTLGLSQVCKLWFGVSKRMPHAGNMSPKILMVVNYCGRRLTRRFGCGAPAYHEIKGATPKLERVGIAWNMTEGLIGSLGQRVGCEILVI